MEAGNRHALRDELVEGKRCLLTQIGIGRKSRKPAEVFANALGFLGSWYATYEDAPVWNNRKVQPTFASGSVRTLVTSPSSASRSWL